MNVPSTLVAICLALASTACALDATAPADESQSPPVQNGAVGDLRRAPDGPGFACPAQLAVGPDGDLIVVAYLCPLPHEELPDPALLTQGALTHEAIVSPERPSDLER
jgi:hypothetical protein